jgi:hypothetical protein
VILRRPPLDPSTLPDDLGVDWSRWSDGRPYRLKRKKDFPNVDAGHARTACELAASRMGKAVRTVRDKFVPEKLIWIQFADAEIPEGNPCPICGSRRILRLHGGFARCPQCKAQLILAQPGLEALDEKDEPEEELDQATADGLKAAADAQKQREKFGERLRALENVHLERSGETAETELYNGWGEQDGARVLVLAEIEPGDGSTLTPDNVYERLRLVKALPAHLFEGLVSVDELAARPASDWDLVL